MIKYDVCLHVGAGGDWLGDFYLHIKSELEKRGLTVILYTAFENIKNVFEKNGLKEYIFLKEYTQEIDVDWATSYLKSIGFSNPRSLYVSEQKFYDLPEKKCLEYFTRQVHAVYQLKDCPPANIYITYEGDEFDHNLFRILCRMNTGNPIYFGFSNLDIRLNFHYDEKRYWQPAQEQDQNIPEDDLQWVKAYIDKYIQEKTNPWGDPKKHDIKFKLGFFVSAFRKIKNFALGKAIDPRRHFWHSTFIYFRRILRRQFAYLKYSENFSFQNGIDYYYFPMHVPFDSQLTHRGLPFYNQVALIEIISNYIPYPAKLIVKEHPMGRGLYSISDIKRIAKLPNIILLPAYANSHNLIPSVKGIFVINSSVGYEGIMYQKPVVTFGRSFFRRQGLTIDVECLYDMEEVFEKIYRQHITTDQIHHFIWRMKKDTYGIDLYNINADNFKEKATPFIEALFDQVNNYSTENKYVLKE